MQTERLDNCAAFFSPKLVIVANCKVRLRRVVAGYKNYIFSWQMLFINHSNRVTGQNVRNNFRYEYFPTLACSDSMRISCVHISGMWRNTQHHERAFVVDDVEHVAAAGFTNGLAELRQPNLCLSTAEDDDENVRNPQGGMTPGGGQWEANAPTVRGPASGNDDRCQDSRQTTFKLCQVECKRATGLRRLCISRNHKPSLTWYVHELVQFWPQQIYHARTALHVLRWMDHFVPV